MSIGGGGGMSKGNFLAPPSKSNALGGSSAHQASNASLNERRVEDNFVRPMALKEKTQFSLA